MWVASAEPLAKYARSIAAMRKSTILDFLTKERVSVLAKAAEQAFRKGLLKTIVCYRESIESPAPLDFSIPDHFSKWSTEIWAPGTIAEIKHSPITDLVLAPRVNKNYICTTLVLTKEEFPMTTDVLTGDSSYAVYDGGNLFLASSRIFGSWPVRFQMMAARFISSHPDSSIFVFKVLRICGVNLLRLDAVKEMAIGRFKARGGATSGNWLLGPPVLSSRSYHLAVRGGSMNPLYSHGQEVDHTTPMMTCIALSSIMASLALRRGETLGEDFELRRTYLFPKYPRSIMGAYTYDVEESSSPAGIVFDDQTIFWGSSSPLQSYKGVWYAPTPSSRKGRQIGLVHQVIKGVWYAPTPISLRSPALLNSGKGSSSPFNFTRVYGTPPPEYSRSSALLNCIKGSSSPFELQGPSNSPSSKFSIDIYDTQHIKAV